MSEWLLSSGRQPLFSPFSFRNIVEEHEQQRVILVCELDFHIATSTTVEVNRVLDRLVHHPRGSIPLKQHPAISTAVRDAIEGSRIAGLFLHPCQYLSDIPIYGQGLAFGHCQLTGLGKNVSHRLLEGPHQGGHSGRLSALAVVTPSTNRTTIKAVRKKDNFFALALWGECAASDHMTSVFRFASSPSHDIANQPNRYLFLPLLDVDTMMAFGRVQLPPQGKVVTITHKQTLHPNSLTKD